MDFFSVHAWVVAIIVAGVGAYLGACADRITYGFHVSRQFLWRIHCPHCFAPQRWSAYVPLVGMIIRRGMCVQCDERVPLHGWFVEIISAATFTVLWWFMFHGEVPFGILAWMQFVSVAAVVIGCGVLFISDLVYDEIPLGAYVATIILVGFVLVTYASWDALIVHASAGASAGLIMVLLLVISNWHWVHAHDILFGALIGFIVGWPAFFVTLAFAYIFAVAGGIIGWGWRTRVWKGVSSFGVYLFIALLFHGALSVLSAYILRV